MKLGSRRPSVEVVTGRGMRILIQWQQNSMLDEVADATRVTGDCIAGVAAVCCM